MILKRNEIKPGDIICVDGWIINTVDDVEWVKGVAPSKPALKITGWRITVPSKFDSKNDATSDGYGSTTILWREEDLTVELLARGKPSPIPSAFETYQTLRREDP